MRTMCKSKIHHAVVKQADLNYIGSITVDKRLLEESDILPYEQVHVVNLSNGARFVTYALEGEEDSGNICVNGAGARLVALGDQVIIISYSMYTEEQLKDFEPKFIFLNEENKIHSVSYGKEVIPC